MPRLLPHESIPSMGSCKFLPCMHVCLYVQVSTEVDAHLSCDTRATVNKALHLLDLYSAAGVEPSRVYIKVSGGSTLCCVRRWKGSI